MHLCFKCLSKFQKILIEKNSTNNTGSHFCYLNQFSCVRPRFFSISSFSLQRSHNGNVVHLVKINSQNLANCVCIYFDFISFLAKSLVLKPFPNLFCSNLSVKIMVKIKSHIHFCFKISVERKTVCFRNEGILTDGKSVLATVHI